VRVESLEMASGGGKVGFGFSKKPAKRNEPIAPVQEKETEQVCVDAFLIVLLMVGSNGRAY